MTDEQQNNKDNIINLADKRRQRRRRLTIGSVRERFLGAKKTEGETKVPGRPPVWLVYLQFFFLLFLVAWLMKQC